MLRVLFFHSRKRLYTYHSLIAFYYFVAVMCESILNTLLQIQKWKYHYILAYIVTSKIIKRTNVELKEFSQISPCVIFFCSRSLIFFLFSFKTIGGHTLNIVSNDKNNESCEIQFITGQHANMFFTVQFFLHIFFYVLMLCCFYLYYHHQ